MPKREMVGQVTSDKMAKTRVVEIRRRVRHAKYGKYILQSNAQ
jgi:small subunit ribosomal protein S17